MKKILLFLFFYSFISEAKNELALDQYVCHKTQYEDANEHPVWLHKTNDQIIVGICGTKAKGVDNFKNIKVQIFKKAIVEDKPFYENDSKETQFLAVKSSRGLLLVEKFKINEKMVELLKHEIVCEKNSCQVKKEACAVLNKQRQKKLFQEIKDKKLKSRIEKAGCSNK